MIALGNFDGGSSVEKNCKYFVFKKSVVKYIKVDIHWRPFKQRLVIVIYIFVEEQRFIGSTEIVFD